MKPSRTLFAILHYTTLSLLGLGLVLPFVAFALGRVAGGAGEFLDHQDFGTDMDMRIPARACKSLTRPRKLA